MSDIGPPRQFVEALLSLREATIDPVMSVSEAPAPTRLAPYSAAVEVSAIPLGLDKPVGTATMVILYDPDQEDNWGGPFRLVGHARFQIDAEQSTDPLLGEAIWQTLANCLDTSGAGFELLVGSVTREITETFGELELQGSVLNADLRCSWSPITSDLGEHLVGWSEALRQNCGLEPNGVTFLGLHNG